MKARCMKCKKQMEMKSTKKAKTKTGRKMTRGKCVKCGTNMAKMG